MFLHGYCDASYGNCLDDRRSFSGYIFKLNDCTISWKARKQRSVALSTCEAEYMALALATKQYDWLSRGINCLLQEEIPMAISTDNNAAIDIAHNPRLTDASKHIDISYHYTREHIINNSLNLLHVPSAENLADICTKGWARPRLNHLCICIFGTKVRRDDEIL